MSNSHLDVVFDVMLPALATAGLGYWVYGGVGVAGVIRRYFRTNRDVDVYVRDSEYAAALDVLRGSSQERRGWTVVEGKPLRNGRPKFELYVDQVELLSVVPVYDQRSHVDFRAATPVRLPPHALRQETRNIDSHKFVVPPDDVIKLILRSVLEERARHGKQFGRRLADAQHVFTGEELAAIERLRRRSRAVKRRARIGVSQ